MSPASAAYPSYSSAWFVLSSRGSVCFWKWMISVLSSMLVSYCLPQMRWSFMIVMSR